MLINLAGGSFWSHGLGNILAVAPIGVNCVVDELFILSSPWCERDTWSSWLLLVTVPCASGPVQVKRWCLASCLLSWGTHDTLGLAWGPEL